MGFNFVALGYNDHTAHGGRRVVSPQTNGKMNAPLILTAVVKELYSLFLKKLTPFEKNIAPHYIPWFGLSR